MEEVSKCMVIKMASPVKLSRKIFESTKKSNPKKAQRVEKRASGEIYGLYPTGTRYTSNETIEVTYEEGTYVEGVE